MERGSIEEHNQLRYGSLADHTPFRAGDGCLLRELIHPQRDELPLRHSLAHASVAPGGRTLPHRLAQNETYYILSGTGEIWISGAALALGPGSYALVPAGAEQWVRCTGVEPLVFLCIVDPPWTADGEEILKERA